MPRTDRTSRLLVMAALAAAVAVPPARAEPAPRRPAFEAVVTRVVDGDTVWARPIDAAGAPPIKIRLQGLDAPERCQAGGEPSRQALADRVAGRRLRVQPLGHDDHGRLLARLLVGDADVGAALVAQGWAWSEGRGRLGGRYGAEQRAAQAAGIGVHADPGALRPRDFRQRFGPCAPAADRARGGSPAG